MNLDRINQLIAATKEVPWGGQKWRIRKLGADQGTAIHKQLGEIKSDHESLQAYYVQVASRVLVDDDGTLSLDSDEGRAALGKLTLAELVELGDMALEWSGVIKADAKKNLPTLSDSPTDSALPELAASCPDTPTTS